MKNKIAKLFASVSLMMLSSCGASNVETTGYMGKKDDSTAIILKYTTYNVMSAPFKLKGSIQAMEKCEIQEKYYLSYTYDSVYSSSSITEYGLGIFTKEQFDSNKSISFELNVDLEKMFPKTSETFKTYILFHGSDYKRSDPYTYYTSEFKYSWEDNKVKISMDF